jgi:DNA-binding protein H-NS
LAALNDYIPAGNCEEVHFDGKPVVEIRFDRRTVDTLVRRIAEEKAKLEERLRRLEYSGGAISPNRARRPYPKVLPKYQNPRNPTEIWSGRGKQPRWVRAQLNAGKKLEHLLIA